MYKARAPQQGERTAMTSIVTIEYGGLSFVPDPAHTLLMQRLAEQALHIEKLEHLVENVLVAEMPVCIECGHRAVANNDLLCDRCLAEYAAWQEHYGPHAFLFAHAADGTPLLPFIEGSEEEVSANAEAVAYLFELQPGATCVELWWKPAYTNECGMTLLYTYDREALPLASCATQEAQEKVGAAS